VNSLPDIWSDLLVGDVLILSSDEALWVGAIWKVWLVNSLPFSKWWDVSGNESMDLLVAVGLTNILAVLLHLSNSPGLWAGTVWKVSSLWSHVWKSVNVVVGESVNLLVHLCLSDIVLFLLDETFWVRAVWNKSGIRLNSLVERWGIGGNEAVNFFVAVFLSNILAVLLNQILGRLLSILICVTVHCWYWFLISWGLIKWVDEWISEIEHVWLHLVLIKILNLLLSINWHHHFVRGLVDNWVNV